MNNKYSVACITLVCDKIQNSLVYTADSIRDSIRTQKNDSQVPTITQNKIKTCNINIQHVLFLRGFKSGSAIVTATPMVDVKNIAVVHCKLHVIYVLCTQSKISATRTGGRLSDLLMSNLSVTHTISKFANFIVS